MTRERERELILNVDDDAAARYARGRLLRNAQLDVIEAANGTQALEKLADRPDLVILDVGLPDINGFEVCRRIKSDPKTATIPVLQVSASFVNSADRTRALEGGADNFLIEPVEPEVLIAQVRAMLRVRRAEAAVHRAADEWQVTFDAINEGVALVDSGARIRRCNRAFGELLGRTCEELGGLSWSELLSSISGMPAEVYTPDPTRREPLPPFQVGDRWVQVRAAVSSDAAGAGIARVMVLTDVTDHMRALAAAEDANRLKDDFLAILSHELRTPLSAIVGWTHLLQTGQLDREATRKALQTIGRNAQIQSQIVSDILDVSRIIAGKLRLETGAVDLVSVVDSALETVRPAAIAKNIALELRLESDDAALLGDERRLGQVAWNLLSNAIKYTPRDGHVRVTVRADDHLLELVVEDDGPGIDPAFLPYVFDRFRQADSSSTRPKGGLGLGLAIVRHVIELHGGTVSADNRRHGSGAVFKVALPRRIAKRTDIAPQRAIDRSPDAQHVATPGALAGLHVLVVDDEPDARDLIYTVLTQAGADVLTAASTAEALPVMERERPDVLLSDIEMPGEDGYALIARVRALGAGNGGSLPAAALTAYAGEDDRTRVLNAGFQMHIAKPVSPGELVAAVAALAGNVRSRQV